MPETEFTDREETVLRTLFTQGGAPTFGPDWREQLAALVEAESQPSSPPAAPLSILNAEGQVVTTTAAEPRSRRALVAAAAILSVIVGLGVIQLAGGGGEPELLEPASFVSSPILSPVQIPEGTDRLTPLDPVGVVALRGSDPDSPTEILISDNGSDWIEVASLPVSDAIADFSTERWVVVGGDTATPQPSVESLTATTLASRLVILVSEDRGSTWQSTTFEPEASGQASITQFPMADSLAIAGDGTVLVGVSYSSEIDLTTPARELGLVGPRDRVVRATFTETRFGPYSVGPDVVGELAQEDFGRDELGLSADQYEMFVTGNDVVPLEGSAFAILEVSPDGEIRELAGPGRANTTYFVPPTLSSIDGAVYGLRGGPNGFETWRLTSDRTWDRTDLPRQVLVENGDWIVGTKPDSASGIEMSLDGGSSYRDFPKPDERTVPVSVFGTTGGAAVVWGEEPTVLVSRNMVTYREGDFRFEWFDDGTVTVYRDDEVFIEDYEDFSGPQDNILIDHRNNILILAPRTGEVVVEVTDEEFRTALATTGPVTGNPTGLAVSWSSDGSEWRYTSLDPVGPGVWSGVPLNPNGEFLIFDALLGNLDGFVVELPLTE
ncbi:MAG: hypothetical protein HKN24_05040 [Acidimicrobiales bacterium]|nr:hypothetical protein [Acidimicrobiales bacterium]